MNNHLGTPAPINLPTTSSVRLKGDDFAQTFEAEFNPNNSSLATGGGVSDKMRHARVMELHTTMHKTGWEKATIINMHSFELRHGMGNIGELRVPKKKEGDPYSKFTISKYRVSMRDLGDAKFIPETVLPVQMAEDICLMAKDFGGVFWYRGDGDPTPDEIQDAYAKMMEFFKREYTKGLDIWNRTKQIHLITEHMRSAAKELFRTGGIPQLPEWVSVTRLEAERKMCDNCGNDIKLKAKTCSFCGYIIDLDFYLANKERFNSVGQANSHRIAQTPVDPIDETKKSVEDFFSQEDPEALNQVKNLDAALSSKLPSELKSTPPSTQPLKPLRSK